MLTKAPKGTKDIMPDEMRVRRGLQRAFGKICGLAGFSEIGTPVFEHTELFSRGVGDSTDVVEKQMYSFEDKAGRSLTLRPEGTAGVCRAFIENKIYAQPQPTKLWYEMACYRYEKPQSGRMREFHQFGVEIFGSPDMLADAEVIGVADAFFKCIGLTDIKLNINSVGCKTCRPDYRDALRDFLKPKYDELCDTCKSRYEKNPMRILDCKSPVCQELVTGAPVMLDHLCDECKSDLESLKQGLSAAGIEYSIDPGIVRGLDYYTKTAFEFISDKIGAQGTVCGGGRYDGLVEELGGPDVPGIGFGLGIERLMMLLDDDAAGKLKLEDDGDAFAYIVFIGDDAKVKAIELAACLRDAGIKAEIDSMNRTVKNQFKQADRSGAKYAITIGEDEIRAGTAQIKRLEDGTQESVSFDEIAGWISSHDNK